MDVFEKYLTFPGKTQPPLSIFEHSLYVLQVVNYFIEQNAAAVQNARLVRAGALCHDAGKIAGDLKSGRWIHTPHTSQFLGELLDHPRMKDLLAQADASITDSERDVLLKMCETHHYHSPDLLRRCKEVVLVPLADVLASAICAGVVGPIARILETSPYLQVSLALVRGLGFANGFDGEVHHIDLPGQLVEDLFLADMVFRLLATAFRDSGVTPLMQRGSSLWVVGAPGQIRNVLVALTVNPRQLFESAFDEQIYDAILSELPAAGSMQIDSLKYVLVNEAIARRLAVGLYTRKSIRTLLERYNLSHLADAADELFAAGLVSGIERLWQPIRAKLLELLPDLHLPESVTDRIPLVADNSLGRLGVGLYAKADSRTAEERLSEWSRANRAVLERADTRLASDAAELLKLFDASGNYNRSLTNVLLELLKMQSSIAGGDYSLDIAQVALMDGQPLGRTDRVGNAALCPVCRRLPQTLDAQGLITGNPKTDSVFQTFRRTRGQIKICRWCFVAGYVDLPIATISKDGQSISKEREYLLVTSPLPRDKLQWLVDFMQHGAPVAGDDEGDEPEEEKPALDATELAELEAMIGGGGGYDQLAVLGLSRKRLSHVKGFVLPTSNALGNLIGLRVPTERLVCGREEKVSGAVRRELIKATMYDLHQVTGAPSMHFGSVTDAAFSVAGKPIDLEEMRRANVAYRIANRYARFGQYRQLNSGMFMLLLSNPRHAVTLMLRERRREARGPYAPGENRIREVIEMAESIADKGWKFELGLRIVSVLVDVDLLPKARSFYKSKEQRFSGVELTKWLQRLKMARDGSSLRQWATQLINALKAGRVASREFKEARGLEIRPPGEETIGKILALSEEILTACQEHGCKLSEFSRDVVNMDYYLLFYHNQRAKEAHS